MLLQGPVYRTTNSHEQETDLEHSEVIQDLFSVRISLRNDMYSLLYVQEYELDRLDLIMDLSIIIVNWNTSELLHQCLNSIYNIAPLAPLKLSWLTMVPDDSISMIENHFPSVILIKNERNQGFARAIIRGYP